MAQVQTTYQSKTSHRAKPKPVLQTLPETGYIRLDKLLVFVPYSPATVWRKIKKDKFPKPVKLSDRVTAWRVEEVRAWLDSFQGG